LILKRCSLGGGKECEDSGWIVLGVNDMVMMGPAIREGPDPKG